MKQIETLHRIRSRCVELLEQAKLRTPGGWRSGNTCYGVASIFPAERQNAIAMFGLYEQGEANVCLENHKNNATYIANASVAFEAALESTVAAIDDIISLSVMDASYAERNPKARAIVAAWQHLLP